MRSLLKVLLLSVIASWLSAADHMGDHMHNGKMTNHMNPGEMTNAQMKQMALHKKMIVDGYHVSLKSNRVLTDGENTISIIIDKDDKKVKNIDISMKFSMPSMPGMEFTEKVASKNGIHHIIVDFSMGGEWQYDLIFKTSDGKMHKATGMVNVQ